MNRWNGEGLPSHFICLRSERDKSVYFWSRGGYLLYNATIIEEILQKPTSFTPKRGAPLSAILFILSTGTGITPLTKSSNIAATTMYFVVKSSFLVFLLFNVTLHYNGRYWRHKRYRFWRHFLRASLRCVKPKPQRGLYTVSSLVLYTDSSYI